MADRVISCPLCGKDRWAPFDWDGASDPGPCWPCRQPRDLDVEFDLDARVGPLPPFDPTIERTESPVPDSAP